MSTNALATFMTATHNEVFCFTTLEEAQNMFGSFKACPNWGCRHNVRLVPHRASTKYLDATMACPGPVRGFGHITTPGPALYLPETRVGARV